MTISVGTPLPSFNLKAVDGKPASKLNINNAFINLSHESYEGQWLVLFFYPKDFTFVCPTEIAGFGALNSEFQAANAQLLGASTDSEFVHLAWKKQHTDLNNLPFPLLSDVKRELTSALGILDHQEGIAQRGVFIIDPSRNIRFTMVTDLSIGRNPAEVLRILKALQTDQLCPCNWDEGKETINLDAIAEETA